MSAASFVPPAHASATGHAGTYRRLLPVELARLYENALDWEHLPHVHSGSFASIACLGTTANSWRARTVSARGGISVIELALDRDSRRWVTRVLDGDGVGNEIWTHAFPVEPRRVDIVVDFFLPHVPEAQRAAAGEGYARLYARLYDEDVAMMVERTRQLDRRMGDRDATLHTRELGQIDKLELPMTVVLGAREFVLAETSAGLRAFPAQCPHQLGPLTAAAVQGDQVICPWHGDRFDLGTGRNLSGRLCHLRPLPVVEVAGDGAVTVALDESAVGSGITGR